MTAQIRLRIVLPCFVAAVAGCHVQRPSFQGPRPTGRVLSVHVRDAQLDYATLEFDVEVDNACGQDLSVTAMRYGLLTGSNTFLSGVAISDATVAAEATTKLSLLDKVVYERLLRALDARAGSEVSFRLELRLVLEADGSQALQAAFTFDGRLVLPGVPQTGEMPGSRPLDVIHIATPLDVVERMLVVARPTRKDLVYDLGCGDGRIAVTAARQYGCRAVGYDVDPRRIRESVENVARHSLADRVAIEQRDIFTVDLAPADIVAFYLNPVVNRRLIPQLQDLKPGARIVSHSFAVGDFVPDEVVTLTSREDGKEHRIYVYTTPLRMDR